MATLEKAVWNWMDTYPQEFADIQKKPNDELVKACGELFDILDSFAENKKGRATAVWPLQIMLLILSPKVLEEIVNADSGAPYSPEHKKKKCFIDSVKKGLVMHGGSNRQFVEAAAVTCVKLCKASTYVSNLDPNNVIFTLVQHVMSDLIALLFNPNKPFSRGQSMDMDLMIDCFVSCFRIKPHSNEIFKVCLNLNSASTYQFVLISSLYRFVSIIFILTSCLVIFVIVQPGTHLLQFLSSDAKSAHLQQALFYSFQNRHSAQTAMVATN